MDRYVLDQRPQAEREGSAWLLLNSFRLALGCAVSQGERERIEKKGGTIAAWHPRGPLEGGCDFSCQSHQMP